MTEDKTCPLCGINTYLFEGKGGMCWTCGNLSKLLQEQPAADRPGTRDKLLHLIDVLELRREMQQDLPETKHLHIVQVHFGAPAVTVEFYRDGQTEPFCCGMLLRQHAEQLVRDGIGAWKTHFPGTALEVPRDQREHLLESLQELLEREVWFW